ncbi:MAG TPA: valine dehydrogenase, partial [Mycobacterium sp.]
RAYGRFVDSFEGRYVTAADIGTISEDLDIIGETTSYVVGRTLGAGGLGDSAHSTALGVVVSMRAAVEFGQGRSLEGLRVGVEGVGKVGSQLLALLRREGAALAVSESHAPARARIEAQHPDLSIFDTLFGEYIDIYAPCGLGATVTPESVDALRASVVCGAANNQLANDQVSDQLVARQILWVPDYVANAGGLIQVAAEREGRPLEDAHEQIEQLSHAVVAILRRAAQQRVTPATAARRIADERLASIC